MNLRKSFFDSAFNSLKLLSVLAIFTSCGAISTGGGSATLNDARPNGIVMAQGPFSGQSGQTVSGSAIIFNMGAPSYIARLEGITAPSEGGLQVWIMSSLRSTPIGTFSLRASSGNQNYSFSTSIAAFSSVCIRSTQQNTFYGCAQLF